jgi:hypothetical protein
MTMQELGQGDRVSNNRCQESANTGSEDCLHWIIQDFKPKFQRHPVAAAGEHLLFITGTTVNTPA